MNGEPGAVTDLADRMSGPLRFGTAGLRGPVRAGPNGMNTTVVVRTTAGVASWLARQGKTGEMVVVGRDARYGSERFAIAAAEVLYAAGFDARLLPGPLPTPVLAFAVKQLKAAAGVQITASHNPPADNGYKLYDSSGSQVVPPSDGEIEGAIASAPPAVAVPRTPGVPVLGEHIVDEYVSRVAAIPVGPSRSLRVAATALHGVGADVLRRALTAAGFTAVHLVPEQSKPDPDFPTVSFPNPEEPGATDLLVTLAAEVDADLAIALDPDADRCAVGVRDRDGSWRMLRGDETGVLLGEHVLSTTSCPDPLVATTIVSSSMLSRIAAAHCARYAETLTGFKWLTRAGHRLVFAYEEALGLCVNPDFVRDKDGIAAAVMACDFAATLKASGRSLLDVLDDLTIRHGVHLTDQLSSRVTDLSVRTEVLQAIRNAPPAELAGVPVSIEDLLPATDAVRISGDGLRVVIRPSGTEPKLKTYLQVVEPVSGSLEDARAVAKRRLAALRTDVSALLSNHGK
ncbi:phospho-sugar mutase [Amycolatopsis alkalitolerans]|uniref:Phospho-sugar mutase n=2 Tax=Amycolatopsis alkalitolerans TaxID=2547244 RepID=A0A5C4LTU0_9PSEU|nr:phospho-sugar mutase [Amycolatopsis alkalitolerans]